MNTLRKTHLRTDTIERYSCGQLSGQPLKRAEQHLIVCETCRDRLEEFESFLLTLREAYGPITMTAGNLSPA
jgi:hypothetical protein